MQIRSFTPCSIKQNYEGINDSPSLWTLLNMDQPFYPGLIYLIENEPRKTKHSFQVHVQCTYQPARLKIRIESEQHGE